MKKRNFTLILTAVLLIAILTGCARVEADTRSAGQIAQSRIAETPTATPVQQMLTAAQAEEIALSHAGFTHSQVEKLRSHYELDDAREEYDVEFRSGDYDYDYTVDAYTGRILSEDREYDPVKTEAPPADAALASDAAITAVDAQDIALKHAGFTADQVTGLHAEYDPEPGGVAHYDVEFNQSLQEYDYEIHAQTGQILSWERDD